MQSKSVPDPKKKSILKGSLQFEQEKQKKLKWDEHGIEAYNQERGGKMKINEPKTPYHEAMDVEADQKQIESTLDDPYQENINENLKQAELNKKLFAPSHKIDINELNQRLKANLEQETEEMQESDEDSDEDEKKRKKKEEFEKKRKMHYNEKLKIQAAMKKMQQNSQQDTD